MPRPPHRPTQLAWQMFLGSQALGEGLLTPHQLRSGAWLRLRHDVYADSRFERDHALACRAATLRLPAEAVIAGASAACLHGVHHAAQFWDDIDVIVPREVRLSRRNGLRVHTTDLSAAEIVDQNGIRTTTPWRTCWDLACWAEITEAVAAIDALLRLGLVSMEGLAEYVTARTGLRGSRLARRAFGLADAGAQSPQESRLRVRLLLAGLPRPVAQHEIRLPDGRTFHPDLAWPQFQVALEYDGQWHADVQQFHHDRRRLNQLMGAGWIVLHVTSDRLRSDFAGIVREVRAALAARGCPLTAQLHRSCGHRHLPRPRLH